MKKIIFLITISVSLFACQHKPTQEEQAYNKTLQKVFDVHDEAMEKMPEMGQLISELEAKKDTTAQGKIYDKAAEALKNENKAMMDWMHDFAKNFPDVQSDKTYTKEEYVKQKELLEKEKTKMEAIAKRTSKSIQKANFILGKK